MGILSKGITLSYGDKALTNLMEIPELGGSAESVEVTCLADSAHMYINGLLNFGDSIDFKFLYEKAQFNTLNNLTGSQSWKVTLPDSATCTFGGECSVKLDGVGVNAALTYTLSIKPNSAMVWATGASA